MFPPFSPVLPPTNGRNLRLALLNPRLARKGRFRGMGKRGDILVRGHWVGDGGLDVHHLPASTSLLQMYMKVEGLSLRATNNKPVGVWWEGKGKGRGRR